MKELRGTPTSFFYNGLISAFSSLGLRFAGMVFNIYLSSAAGAQAMGLLSLVYSTWGFILTAGCAGGGLAATRMCAECASLGEDMYKATKKCLSYALICSAAVGSLLFIFASPISLLLSDSRTMSPLRLLALSLPFISMSGALSGYFSAGMRAYKNAACQIAEQAVRIGITVLIFTFFPTSDAGTACTSIILGSVIADITSFLILYTIFILDRRKHFKRNGASGVTFGKIAKITVPVCISACIRSGLVSIEHILIPKGLREFGYTSSEALEVFGTVHGMALPVILFCIAIPSAFASLLIPRFTEYNTQSNLKEIRYVASRAYRPALGFALGVAAFLTLSANLLGNKLYPGTDTAKYIYAFAPLIPIMYIDSVSDSVLKGMGEQLYSMKINIIDALISVSAVFFLVPKIGTGGYVIAVYLSETFNTCASLIRVMKLTGYRMPVFRFVIFPLLLATIAANITSLFYKQNTSLDMTHLLIFGAVIYTSVYLFLLRISGNVNREERGYMRQMLGAKIKKRDSEMSRPVIEKNVSD